LKNDWPQIAQNVWDGQRALAAQSIPHAYSQSNWSVMQYAYLIIRSEENKLMYFIINLIEN
jgi:hypothetical protein